MSSQVPVVVWCKWVAAWDMLCLVPALVLCKLVAASLSSV